MNDFSTTPKNTQSGLDQALDIIELRAYSRKLEAENRFLSATLLTLLIKLTRAGADTPDVLALVESAYVGERAAL